MYSTLRSNQTSTKKAELTGWISTGSPGLVNLQSGSFHTRFTAEIAGLYSIDANLILFYNRSRSIKAALAINRDISTHSGLTGLSSNHSSEYTLTFSGLAKLSHGDAVSIFVTSLPEGASWTVLTGSTFFVRLLNSKSSVPAFHAVLPCDITVPPLPSTGRLFDWATNGSAVFQQLSGFSPSLGEFCVSCNGVYKINVNILTNVTQDTDVTVTIETNSGDTIVSAKTRHIGIDTVSIGGVFAFAVGDCFRVRINSSVAAIRILTGSGFSAVFISGLRSNPPFLSYPLNGTQYLANSGLHDVNFSDPKDSPKAHVGLVTNRDGFTVAVTGSYIVSAVLDIMAKKDNPVESLRLLAIVNRSPSSTLSSATIASVTSLPYSGHLSLTGVLYLRKGDKVTASVSKSSVSPLTIQTGHFSVALTTNEWPGLSVTLARNQALTRTGWNEIGDWNTGLYKANGDFSFDDSFDEVSGRYVVPLDGMYIISCNVIVTGSGATPLGAMIAVDGSLDLGSGLYSIHDVPNKDMTVPVSVSLRLSQGQYLSVFVFTSRGSSWTLSNSTGLSVVFSGAGLTSVPGSFAVTLGTQSHSSTGWQEVSHWTTEGGGVANTTFRTGGSWDASKSQYTPEVSGLYLVTANLLMSHDGASEIMAQIVPNGQSTKITATQAYHQVGSVSRQSRFTLSISGILSLTTGEYVSVFIKSVNGINWRLLSHSSFSITLVSSDANQHSTGLNAFKILSDTALSSGVFNIIRWRTSPFGGMPMYAVFSKRLDVTSIPSRSKAFVEVSLTGFYAVQITVQIIPSHVGRYILSACIDDGFAANSLTAVIGSEDGSTKFGITVFGVLYLTKGQKVWPCTSASNSGYTIRSNGGFSIALILARDSLPGLREERVGADWTSQGASSLYRRGAMSTRAQAPNTGIYLITLSVSDRTAPVCLGNDRCTNCLFLHNGDTIVMTKLLQKTSEIFPCESTNNSTILRSAQYLPNASENNTVLFSPVPTFFSSSGWHSLSSWRSAAGLSAGAWEVSVDGLYVVALYLVLSSSEENTFKIDVTSGNTLEPVLHATSAVRANTGILMGTLALARMRAGEKLRLKVYSEKDTTWAIQNHSLVTTALMTSQPSTHGLAVKLRQDVKIPLGGLWYIPEDWKPLDLGLAHSRGIAGRFVAGDAGVYLISVTSIIVKHTEESNCTLELIASINGDVTNSNGPRTSRVIQAQPGPLTVTLSISVSLLLTKWQAVYPMVRITPAYCEAVLSNQTSFFALLIDKDVLYTRCNESGPYITRHPPPFLLEPADVTISINLTCAALSAHEITYKWLHGNKVISFGPSLFMDKVSNASAGRYICIAESAGVSVASQPAVLEVFDSKPAFRERHYSKEVLETTEIGEVLLGLRFSALGRFHRATNVSLTVTKGNKGGIFMITPNVSREYAALITAKPLDHEHTSRHELTITATNTDTKLATVITVTLNVTNTNDHAPIFNQSFVPLFIPENTTVGTTVYHAQAYDRDLGTYGHVTYQLIPGRAWDTFAVNKTTGDIKVTRSLDRESNASYSVTVMASDGKFQAFLEIDVHIQDINDQYPVFSPQNYSVAISEESWVRLPVLQVTAVDMDSGSNSQVTYSIVDGNSSFSIDPNTGQIIVHRTLDFEVTRSFILRVQARDNGKPALVSRDYAYVTINITDENDNNPVFDKRSYNFSITEDVAKGTVFGFVRANDADSGKNAKLSYSIPDEDVRKTFAVDEITGNLSVVGDIDRERTGIYSFVVVVTDHGSSPRVGFAVVSVRVKDVNDNQPVFRPQNYTVRISEGTSVGTKIVWVHAHDEDIGPNALITYHIDSGNKESIFDIEDGTIVLNGTLDREVMDQYTLGILATDNGEPPQLSRDPAIVVITIEDINDNYPEFNASVYSVNISEDTSIGTQVLSVYASDKDLGSNAHVQYFIIASANDDIKRVFDVNKTTGAISTTSNLDFESANNRFQFQVEARDNGKPALYSRTTVEIMVTDVNDNRPVFVGLPRDISVNENLPVKSTVLIAHAHDEDSGSNSDVRYNITHTYGSRGDIHPDDRTFDIETVTGRIFTAKQLDRENIAYYILVLKACDLGRPRLCTNANITIRLRDKNDNRPALYLPKQVNIREDSPVNTTIFTAYANDSDTGENARIIYDIKNVTDNHGHVLNPYSIFGIKPDSGRLFINRPLDRERVSRYDVTIEARDGEITPHSSQGTVAIVVDDVNDNNPKCNSSTSKVDYMISTREYESLLTLHVCDNDEGNNSVVEFTIARVVTDSECEGRFEVSSNGTLYNTVPLVHACKYTITVTVRDWGEPRLTGTCDVIVNVVEESQQHATNKGVKGEGLTTAEMIGVGVSVAVLVLLIISICFYCNRKRKSESISGRRYGFDNTTISKNYGMAMEMQE
ncbi:uncharacterized protein LOC116615378 isoform X2 [Nematostella vectensis]|nr:uncharacterized protein LOC116615378 isoform X2 [Nematostella vectensis]